MREREGKRERVRERERERGEKERERGGLASTCCTPPLQGQSGLFPFVLGQAAQAWSAMVTAFAGGI